MSPDSLALDLFNFLLTQITIGLYFGYFNSSSGASPGKSIMGLRVVQLETGRKPDFQTAFFRDAIGKFVSSALLGIGFLMAGFRADKRALHDLMFRTRVVHENKQNRRR